MEPTSEFPVKAVYPPPVERKTVKTVLTEEISLIKWWFDSFNRMTVFTKLTVFRLIECASLLVILVGATWS